MKKIKRIITLALTVCMLCGIFLTSAYATECDNDDVTLVTPAMEGEVKYPIINEKRFTNITGAKTITLSVPDGKKLKQIGIAPVVSNTMPKYTNVQAEVNSIGGSYNRWLCMVGELTIHDLPAAFQFSGATDVPIKLTPGINGTCDYIVLFYGNKINS